MKSHRPTRRPEMLAEFGAPGDLVRAIVALSAAGVRDLETFTPFDVPGVRDALADKKPPTALICLLGALAGGALAYWIQWWTSFDYPLNVGGRPIHAIPSFIPIAFEGTILGGALATVAIFLWRCRLPRLWHPLFEVEGFERATDDRFFLQVAFEPAQAEEVRRAIAGAHPLRVRELPP